METSKLKKRLKIHSEEKILTRRKIGAALPEKWQSASHGGFDNNIEIISQTLERITGKPVVFPVDDLVGF